MYHTPQIKSPQTLAEALEADRKKYDEWYKAWLKAKEEFQRKELEKQK